MNVPLVMPPAPATTTAPSPPSAPDPATAAPTGTGAGGTAGEPVGWDPGRAPLQDTVVVTGETVWAGTPEGTSARMPLANWVARLRPALPAGTGMILPDGVRAVVAHPSGRGVVWVTEIPPRVWLVDWLAPDSPADFGEGATYVRRSLAFPYLVLLTTFGPDSEGIGASRGLGLDRRRVELFWRKAPLESLDDELLYPALLNVTKFFGPSDPEYRALFAGRPLAWLCTQHLVVSPDMRSRDEKVRMRAGYRQLLALLFGQSFNRSSEHHPDQGEQMSWYTWSVRQGVDARIADTARWEEASRKDPLWVLDVPWLPVELTLGAVIDRIFGTTMGLPPAPPLASAGDLGRIVFKHGEAGMIRPK